MEAAIRLYHNDMPNSGVKEYPLQLMHARVAEGKSPHYSWKARMDRMILFEDMLKTVDRIEQLAASGQIRQILLDSGYGNSVERIRQLSEEGGDDDKQRPNDDKHDDDAVEAPHTATGTPQASVKATGAQGSNVGNTNIPGKLFPEPTTKEKMIKQAVRTLEERAKLLRELLRELFDGELNKIESRLLDLRQNSDASISHLKPYERVVRSSTAESGPSETVSLQQIPWKRELAA
jgi:hypothetical protein